MYDFTSSKVEAHLYNSEVDEVDNNTATVYWTLEFEIKPYGVKSTNLNIKKIVLNYDAIVYKGEEPEEPVNTNLEINPSEYTISVDQPEGFSTIYPTSVEVNKKTKEVLVSFT